jgi:2-amino-4-hydroxy-6-hydroxymethyldihydropteridine diphosphokinase
MTRSRPRPSGLIDVHDPMSPSPAASDGVPAYVGLGANLGEPAAQLQQALAALAELPGSTLDAVSSLYRTRPVDADGPDYLNAVARLSTSLSPPALLQALHRIEQAAGRERPYRNAPRRLDLDLLLHGNSQLQTPTLTLPHPRLHLRAFVLVPLLELDPALRLPGRGAAADELPAVAGQAIERIATPSAMDLPRRRPGREA